MKKISVITTAFIVLAAVLLTFQITFLSMENKYDKKFSELEIEMSDFSKLFEMKQLVDSNYINDYDKDDVIDALASAYSYGIGDKYGRYYGTDDLDFVSEQYFGEVVGVGITIIYNEEENAIEIYYVSEGSPAEEAGLASGDLVTEIDGKTIEELGGYEKAVDFSKGVAGTEVTFTCKRGSETFEKTMTRSKINSTNVYYHMLSDGMTGFVRITQFGTDTAEQFKAAMASLQEQNAKRYVFDMRNNRGGELNEITSILDYLLPAGPIVRIVDKNGEETVKTSDASCIDAPMAVLVNGSTASAAELFTIGLRDYKKAVIVGTQTYGKGTVQKLYTLSDGSIFSLSYRMYNGPYSDNYEGVGITPDIISELSEEASGYSYLKLTEDKDDQLSAALKAFNNFDDYFEE